MQPSDLGHIGDSIGAVLVIVGNYLGLLGREKIVTVAVASPPGGPYGDAYPRLQHSNVSDSHPHTIPVVSLWSLIPVPC